MATGFVVMVFAFGPSVFFLFAERIAALQRAQDAEQIPRGTGILQSHGKDTVMWTALAVIFLCLPDAACVVTQTEAPSQLVSIARISFMVMGATGCISAVRAWRNKERLWGLSMVFGLYLMEAIVMCALIWAHMN